MAREYRKKPVVVEAVQWTGENHAEMCKFIDPEVFEIIPRVGLVIHTLEGDHTQPSGTISSRGLTENFIPVSLTFLQKLMKAPHLHRRPPEGEDA